jgi:hypothetical protein
MLPAEIRRAVEPLGALHEDGAEDRAGERAEPADDDHRQGPNALGRLEHLLTHGLLVHREQGAGHRCHEPGDGEGQQLGAHEVDPERLRRPRVFAGGDEHPGGARSLQPAGGPQHDA